MQGTEQIAIQANGLSKRFKGGQDHGIQALSSVSFSVPSASVFCILGPNGAGKTTLIRILTTLLQPDSGTAAIEGADILKEAIAVRSHIGVVAQANHFDRYLTIWQNLMMHAQMHGLPKKSAESEINRLLKKVALFERRHQSTDVLSGGMQRRVALIRALIHRPKVLFLDEPTTGLDPEARQEIWEMIHEFKQSSTVILTTHYMEEADRLSDTILMLNQGKVVMQGTPRELKRTIGPGNLYEAVFTVPKAKMYLSALRMKGIEAVKLVNDYQLQFTLTTPDELFAILPFIEPKHLQRIGEKEIALDDVFLAVAAENRDGRDLLAKEGQGQ